MQAPYSVVLLLGTFLGGAAWLAASTSLAFWSALKLLVSATILWVAVLFFDIEAPP